MAQRGAANPARTWGTRYQSKSEALRIASASARTLSMTRWLAVSLGSVLAAGAWACESEEASVIAGQRARFREVAPEQYVIATCGTGALAGCSREVVIAGRVVTAEVTGPDDPAWRPVVDLAAWSDQVSSMFESALDLSGSLRVLEFEPRWHFVREYHSDVDGPKGRVVTCFLPHRVDLQQCQTGRIALGALSSHAP
jgi:hypothetical protein